MDFFDFDEFDRLVAAAEQIDARTPHRLAGWAGGPATGEMRALRWSDVNLEKRKLRVECSDWRGQVCTTKGGQFGMCRSQPH